MITLKNVLKINAISSGATGLLLIVLPGFFAELLNVSLTGIFVEVGIFLVLFALFVFFHGTRTATSFKAVTAIIILDCLWVAGSVLIILFQLFSISFIGYLMVGAVAAWVGLMAILQMNGLRKIRG